ncbi:prolyl aminopeptidase [Thiosocius teredinicola]|uniref:prolyl aminopeptidase n=1 Tax=Thiosocius teredinicola TaxID=1973002 RepID=UPI0009912EFF
MHELYPAIDPYLAEHIDVGEGHQVYVEQCGNPAGEPVVFLHGGPGSGCNPVHRRFFDPSHYRIILLDQRGCGRSRPLGSTEHNDIESLAGDLETIRTRLAIARWQVFAGSWGATLAVFYARRYPEAVASMVLRGVFLARSEDLAWFFGDSGAARFFPDAYEQFVADISAPTVAGVIDAYHRHIHGADTGVALHWAVRWVTWADRLVTWTWGETDSAEPQDEQRLLAKTRIETHYALNRYFVDASPLLDDIDSLAEMRIVIVHGRRDLVCPVEGAWALHRRLPASRLNIVPNAGHLQIEPAMIDALVQETDRLRA